jgi:hypothetical protein
MLLLVALFCAPLPFDFSERDKIKPGSYVMDYYGERLGLYLHKDGTYTSNNEQIKWGKWSVQYTKGSEHLTLRLQHGPWTRFFYLHKTKHSHSYGSVSDGVRLIRADRLPKEVPPLKPMLPMPPFPILPFPRLLPK